MTGGILAQTLLVALPLTPVLGAIVAGFLPERFISAVRAVGWSASILALAVWVALRALLSGGDEMLVSLQLPWVPSLGIGLHLALDQTGLLLAGVAAFVGVAASVGTLPSEESWSRSHVVCLLLAEAGILGVSASWDLILFIVFWEVTLVPFFFLMGRSSTHGGAASATQFFVISVSASVLLWVGVLWLVQMSGEPRTFDLVELTRRQTVDLPAGVPWLFAAAFLMRLAAFPLHTWFPAAVAGVPPAGAMLLAGGVLPLGGFGVVHLLGRLFGPELGGLSTVFLWLGLATALGGGLAAVVQRDLKRLLAYVLLAQLGLALVGLASGTEQARQGGMLLLMATGVGGAALFLFAGAVCQARGSQRILDIGGLWRSHPLFTGLAFAAVASAAAMPGTAGFVGTYRILWSTSERPWILLLAAGAVLVIGSAVLWAFRRILGGVYQAELWSSRPWPRRRQVWILALLAAALLAVGLMPGLVAP